MMSTLRPTAKEFVPSWLANPPPPPPPPAAPPLAPAPAADAQSNGTVDGADVAFWGDAQWQDIPMADALALLACWFPSYAQPALQAIYEVNNKDLHLTLQDLCNLQLQADGPQSATRSNGQPPPPPRASRPAPRPPPPPKPVTLTDADFPSLGGPSAAAAASGAPARAPISFASIVKKAAPAGAAAPAPAPQPATPKPAAAQPAAPPAPVTNGSAGAKQEVPWLETGETVAQEYATAREDARDLARVRNACFQQATMAYMAGNKALAKELAEKGRHHNEAMKAAHAAASAAIFRSRNKRLSSRGSSGSGLVDLHGLHVAEATALLDDLLSHPNSRTRLLLCVGTGHHTKGSRTPARLPQAVEAYLTRHQLQHRYLQPGLLEVQLR